MKLTIETLKKFDKIYPPLTTDKYKKYTAIIIWYDTFPKSIHTMRPLTKISFL